VALRKNNCYYTFFIRNFNIKINKEMDKIETAIEIFCSDDRNERSDNDKLSIPTESIFNKQLPSKEP